MKKHKFFRFIIGWLKNRFNKHSWSRKPTYSIYEILDSQVPISDTRGVRICIDLTILIK